MDIFRRPTSIKDLLYKLPKNAKVVFVSKEQLALRVTPEMSTD